MKPRKHDESDAHYIKRLEASNADLRAQGKWAEKVGRAVTWLACDASLAFQAMAEKAGVRSHPSVTAAVQLFDTIAHPQWTEDEATLPEVKFPNDWDLDPPGAWSGDADMELNAGIASALEYLETRAFNAPKEEAEHIRHIMEALEKPLQGIVEAVRPAMAERRPIVIPDDATRDDLAEIINNVSWRALDLAQDMTFANELLRRDLRAAAYRRVCRDLYELANLNVPVRNPQFDVKVLGAEAPF